MTLTGPEGSDRRLWGLSLSISAGVPIALMVAGLTALPNGLFYDVLQRQFDRPAEGRVLLVEGNISDALTTSADWSRLAVELSVQGAEHVVLVGLPVPTTLPLSGGTELIIAPRAIPDPSLPGNWTLLDQNASPPPVAVSVTPPAQYGVHRTQVTRVDMGTGRVPTLEARVAGLGDQVPFHVRFGGGLGTLQRVSVADLLAGRVPGDLVAGRTVLVGLRDATGLTTPVNSQWPNVSLLEYHAFAMETALSGRLPRPLHPVVVVILVVLSGIAAVPIYVRTGPRGTLPVVLGVTVAITVAGVAAFRFLDVVAPVGELLTSQAILSLLVWRSREISKERHLRRRLQTLRQPMEERAAGSEGGIVQAAMRIGDGLGLSRHLLLALANDGHSTVVCGKDLAPSDLPQDVMRPGHPVLVRAASIRTAVAIGEGGHTGLHVLALRHRSETLGYWVVDPQPGRRDETLRVLPLYADLLAEHLAKAPRQTIRHETGLEGQLDDASNLLLERLRIQDAALQRGASGVAVVDLFGTLHFAGGRFLERVARAETPDTPAEPGWDPAAILASLTGLDEEAVRARLTDVLLGRSLALPASGSDTGLVRVSPASRRPGEPPTVLILEIVDEAQTAAVAKAEAALADENLRVLRNDLEAMHLALALLRNTRLTDRQRGQTVTLLGEAVSRAARRIAKPESPDHAVTAPALARVEAVNVLDALSEAISHKPGTEGRINIDAPAVPPAVDVPNATLEPLLAAILELLLEDAETSPTALPAVRVQIDEDARALHLRLASAGAGLPEGRLQEHLEGERPAETRAMQTIVRLQDELRRAGAHLTATSEIGGGLGFALRLRKLGSDA
jgi:hypothetical protein